MVAKTLASMLVLPSLTALVSVAILSLYWREIAALLFRAAMTLAREQPFLFLILCVVASWLLYRWLKRLSGRGRSCAADTEALQRVEAAVNAHRPQAHRLALADPILLFRS
jgi:membrane protein implicated in regulation of membrane protease activity